MKSSLLFFIMTLSCTLCVPMNDGTTPKLLKHAIRRLHSGRDSQTFGSAKVATPGVLTPLNYSYGGPVLYNPINAYCICILFLILFDITLFITGFICLFGRYNSNLLWELDKKSEGNNRRLFGWNWVKIALLLKNQSAFHSSLVHGTIRKSDWMKITKSYYYAAKPNSKKYYVNGNVNIVKRIDISGANIKTNLTAGSLPAIIQDEVNQGKIPLVDSKTSNNIVFILTSKNIYETSTIGTFLSDYCGYHDGAVVSSSVINESQQQSTSPKSATIFYAFIGDPSRTADGLRGCGGPFNNVVSPNGDVGVDAMLSTISHELVETITDGDPTLLSWYDLINNEENGMLHLYIELIYIVLMYMLLLKSS